MQCGKREKMKNYLALDVGGTAIKYAVMDENADISISGETVTPTTSLDDFIQTLMQIYESVEYTNPEALVISAPGRIDSSTGYFHTGGALGYLNCVNLPEALRNHIPLPICVLNDAKAAALAELWKGSMEDVNSGLILTLGTGIGGAVIIDGKLWQGHNFAAGEFSGIPVHWDTRTGGYTGTWANINCTRSMIDRYCAAKNQNPDNMNGKQFFQAIHDGDRLAMNELEWFCETLATGLLGLQLILDVEKIAIGGGISRQPLLIETLNEVMDRQYERKASCIPATRPIVEACRFSSDANLIGALRHYLLQKEEDTVSS